MVSPIPVIGIVGGVGSGKSTLSRWIAEHYPVVVIDADKIGHELLREPAVRVQLRAVFGDSIFNAVGAVHRPELARRVFGDSPEQQQARKQLDELLHPLIRAEIVRCASAVDPKTVSVILLDAALLLEAGWHDLCQAVIFVDTPDDRRATWVEAHRGWTPEELHRREASQWPVERKRRSAHAIVANTGEIAAAGAAMWGEIQSLL